jgi:hypothetical protein
MEARGEASETNWETVAIEPTQKSIRLHGACSGAQSRSHIWGRKGPQRFRKIEDAAGELKASLHLMSLFERAPN